MKEVEAPDTYSYQWSQFSSMKLHMAGVYENPDTAMPTVASVSLT